VKGLIALVLGGFGLGAWLGRRRRRAAAVEELSPADELRARLAETRAEPEPEPEPEVVEADPEARRREVHERARQSLDELA
jgi:hypothetical protein